MSTVPIALNTKSLPFFTVANREVPCEGPRAIPLLLNFAVGSAYSINLQNTESLKRLSMVQGIFIDNSANASSVSVLNPLTSQLITVAPGHQAFHTVLCPNPAQFNFSSGGNVTVTVHLLNFPVTDSDWSTF